MSENLFYVFLGLGIGSGVIGVALFLKEKMSQKQFLSVMSLGAILLVAAFTRITITEADVLVEEQPVVEDSNQFGFFTTPTQHRLSNTEGDALSRYATSTTTKTTLTKEELILFYETVVVDSMQDWVTLVLGNGNGIMFKSSTASFSYGPLDELYCVSGLMGEGLILGETIEYAFH